MPSVMKILTYLAFSFLGALKPVDALDLLLNSVPTAENVCRKKPVFVIHVTNLDTGLVDNCC